MKKLLSLLIVFGVCVNANAEDVSFWDGDKPSTALQKEVDRVNDQRASVFGEVPNKNPSNFPNIATPKASNIDIADIAKKYERKVEAKKTEGLIAFVSFSMPEESLKKIITDTTKAGGIVVFNGFLDGSKINSTVGALRKIVPNVTAIQVNPNAFIKYKIDKVPAYVLVKQDASLNLDLDKDGCALPGHYVVIRGDVDVAFAMQKITEKSPTYRLQAERYIRLLEGN